jgi:hypothetical protein
MTTFNAPVATVVQDSDYTVLLKIVGQNNANTLASNTKVLQSNTVRFANGSRLCVIEVVSVDYAVSTSNGFISLEYGSQNNNTTILTFGKGGMSGQIDGIQPNPVNANTTGDINLYASALDANDTYSLMITLRKNDFNGAFANLAALYNR